MKSSVIAFLFSGVLGTALVLSGFDSDREVLLRGIDGVWSGEDTNGRMSSAILSIRLTTNGQGALLSSGKVGIPGTFTYTRSNDWIVPFTNDTPRLTGTLRYDPSADILIYQQSVSVATALRESRAPVLLTHDTNDMNKARLDCMIGATNYHELLTRLVHFSGLDTNDLGSLGTKTSAQGKAQPGGAVNTAPPHR